MSTRRSIAPPRPATGTRPVARTMDAAAPARRLHAMYRPFGGVQARLTVSDPADRHEVEAARVAREVVRAQDAAVTSRPAIFSLPAAPVASQARQEEEEEEVQAAASGAMGARVDTPPALARDGGSPMPEGLASDMGARFGADFRDVRLHTDGRSSELCRAVAAKAFTFRNHIYFGAGEFNPRTASGQHLIAHELTHTIQQNASPRLPAFTIQPPSRDGTGGERAQTAAAPRVSASADAPSVQMLKVTNGGFGRALEEYTDIHDIEDRVVRLLIASPTFMRTARILDRHYVWRSDSFDWEYARPSRVLQYNADNEITNGPAWLRGKREFMVVGGGAGAAFMPFDAPDNQLSGDIIVLNPRNDEDFLRSIAHEAAHARNHVGQAGPPPATLAAAVTAGIQEEVSVRGTEAQVANELTRPARRQGITFGANPTTVPAEVEREYSPGLGLTYLENIFFSFRLGESQRAAGLSDDEAADIRTRVDARFPAEPFILGKRPSRRSGLFELDQYAETYFDYKTAQADWLDLRRRVPPGSRGFAAEEERMRTAHARRYFSGRVAYRALPP